MDQIGSMVSTRVAVSVLALAVVSLVIVVACDARTTVAGTNAVDPAVTSQPPRTLAEAVHQGLCGPSDTPGAAHILDAYGQRPFNELASVLGEVRANLDALQNDAFAYEFEHGAVTESTTSPGYQPELSDIPDGAIVRSVYTPKEGNLLLRRSTYLPREQYLDVYQVRDAFVLLSTLDQAVGPSESR